MKKLLLFAVIAAVFVQCNRPEPSYEGVLMTNYGRDGIGSFAVVTGAQGPLGPGSELYQVPMWEQGADPAEVTINAKDAGVFVVDPSYQYEAIRGQGPQIIFNYKRFVSSDEDQMMNSIEEAILNRTVNNAYREEASKFTTDSLMNNRNVFEQAVENRLKAEFTEKFFNLKQLTSGLRPPQSMLEAIEKRNNAIQQAEQVRNELEVAKMQQQKAQIEQQTNQIQSQGLTDEILMARWIEAIRNSSNRVIITDGRTPVILNN